MSLTSTVIFGSAFSTVKLASAVVELISPSPLYVTLTV